jgi:hypothetical protein
MEIIDIRAVACLLPRAADGDGWFHQLLLTVAADVELKSPRHWCGP